MFNLHKESQVTNINTRLQEDRDRFDNNAQSEPGNLDWLLSDDRKEEDLNTITEKQLGESDTRVGMEPVITEAQLNNSPGGVLTKNRDSETTPLQDMAKQYEKEFIDAFKKAQKDNEGVYPDMPKPGSQMIDGKAPEVPTKERSQLLSNYETREEFNKKNVGANAASAIKDADAMLFHIYRTAVQEGRELTDQEKQVVTDINSGKVRLLTAGVEDPRIKRQVINDAPGDELESRAPGAWQEDLEKQEIEFNPPKEDKRDIQEDLFNWLGNKK